MDLFAARHGAPLAAMDRFLYFNALRIAERAGVTVGFPSAGTRTAVVGHLHYARTGNMDPASAAWKRKGAVGDRRKGCLI